MEKSDKSNNIVQEGFFQHVFNFDDESKSNMINIIQFSVLAIIPVLVLNKIIQKYVPELDEEKGSVELIIEVVGQLIIMFLGMLIIFRIVSYVPTYSQTSYPESNIINLIIPFLTIVLSLQTRLGEKVNLLLERVVDLVQGNTSLKNNKNKNNQNQSSNNQINPQHQASRADNLTNMNNNNNPVNNLAHNSMNRVQTSPDFNNMYQGPNMPNMSNEAGINIQEPMAANSVLGGGFGAAL